MTVNNIKIKNFRNISSLFLKFDKEINVICGENAQGKTNIIEALWLFSGAKSFRNTADSSFIKFGEKSAKTEVSYILNGIENNAKIEFSEKRNAFFNDKKLQSTANLAGKFNAVIFSPSDLNIIVDGPDKRRRFLDISIGQLYPNYIEILRSYNRAVQQRNKIIKDYRYDKTVSIMLEIFEQEIVDKGNKIIKYRKNYLNKLSPYINNIYSGISGGKEEISSEYTLKNGEEINTKMLENSREKDMYTASTSVGPHRDDINFKINGISARSYGSQGQKRSVALSLKLAGAEVIKEISGEYPICLLDDVMSELDEKRQDYVLNHINDRQVFLTCCDPSQVLRLCGGKSFLIKGGEII